MFVGLIATLLLVVWYNVGRLKVIYPTPIGQLSPYQPILLNICSFDNLAISKEHWLSIAPPLHFFEPLVSWFKTPVLAPSPAPIWILQSLQQSVTLAPFYITSLLDHRLLESGKPKLLVSHLLTFLVKCLRPLILASCNVLVDYKKMFINKPHIIMSTSLLLHKFL